LKTVNKNPRCVEINDRDRWSVRGQLLIEPSADLKIRLIGDYGKIDEVCCQTSNQVIGTATRLAIGGVGGQFPTDFFSYDNFLNVVPVNTNENYGVSGQADWNLGNLTVTSITSYLELGNFFNQDIDFTSADISNETRDQGVSTFTQELRIASDFDGPINFLFGGYYFDESITQDSSLSVGRDFRNFAALQVAAASAPVGTPASLLIAGGNAALRQAEEGLGLPLNSILAGNFLTTERFAMDNQSWSIFGTVEFEVTDATGTISHKKTVTIYQELISSSLAAATAPDVSLGKAEALNTYVRLGENTPGAGPIFVSADGTVKMQLYLDNQGQLQLAPVT
jgi:hypothetical protein